MPSSADIVRIMQLLDDVYGHPVWEPRYQPVDELIYTILSQNTTDANTVRSFGALRDRFPTWADVRDAPVEEIEEAISHGGLAATKAPRIKAVLAALDDCPPGEAGAPASASPGNDDPEASDTAATSAADGATAGKRCQPNLAVLDEMTDQEALDYLTGLPGVGPKTAACVLMFSLGRPVMPVDTHVHRVARRLGLIGAKVSAEAAHPILSELAGPKNVYALHVNLVLHGRRVCRARRPACHLCALAGVCPSAGLV